MYWYQQAAAGCARLSALAPHRVHPGWRRVNAVSAALRSSAEASMELSAPPLPLSASTPHAVLDLADGISGRNAVPDSSSSAELAPAAPPPHTALRYYPSKLARTTVLGRPKHTCSWGQAEVNASVITKLRRKVIKKCASNPWRTCAACTSRREWTQTEIYQELARHACTEGGPLAFNVTSNIRGPPSPALFLECFPARCSELPVVRFSREFAEV
jgi:hypothetical protein